MDMEKNTAGTTDKRLRRTHEGRMVAGVCSGAGRYFDVDPNILRLGLAAFTLFGGAGIALYVLGWVLIPDEGAQKSIGEDLFEKASDSPTVQDAVQKSKEAFNKNKNRSHA